MAGDLGDEVESADSIRDGERKIKALVVLSKKVELCQEDLRTKIQVQRSLKEPLLPFLQIRIRSPGRRPGPRLPIEWPYVVMPSYSLESLTVVSRLVQALAYVRSPTSSLPLDDHISIYNRVSTSSVLILS